MSTTSTTDFDTMLRSYAPDSLLFNEAVKRNWFFTNVEKDDSWLGGDLEIRFQSARASSIKFGSLTDTSDIGKSKFVKGTISSQPEAWGSLIFEEKDLMRHGKLSEQNFLKLLPNQIEDFSDTFKSQISLCFTNGPKIANITAEASSNVGKFTVDRIERFELDQKFRIKDDNTAAADAYVKSINVNTSVVELSSTRGGAAADFSAYTIAQNVTLYLDGQETAENQLTSLKSSLLSAANGGSANLYGVSKLAAPYTQAINIAGTAMTASTILDDLFAAQTTIRQKGHGNANVALMSYKNLGSCLTKLEATKGAYRQADDLKASLFGWSEIVIMGVKGMLKLVAIEEMDDDWIPLLDMTAIKMYSNGGIQKRVGPDGLSYYTVRNTSGYQYIVDVAFMGDAVLERPSRCGIIYDIAY